MSGNHVHKKETAQLEYTENIFKSHYFKGDTVKTLITAEIFKALGEKLIVCENVNPSATVYLPNGESITAHCDRLIFVSENKSKAIYGYEKLNTTHREYLLSCIRLNCMSIPDLITPKIIPED